MKTRPSPLIILLLSVTLVFSSLFLSACSLFEKIPAPDETVVSFLSSLKAGDTSAAAALAAPGLLPWASDNPTTEYGQKLLTIYRSGWSYEITACTQSKKTAQATVRITGIDMEKAAASAWSGMGSLLSAAVENATLSSEIYDESRNYRQDVLDSAFAVLFDSVFSDPSVLTSVYEINLSLQYSDKQWLITDTGSLEAAITGGSTDPDGDAQALYNAAVTGQPYIALHYTLPEDSAVPGNVPDQNNYGSTTDPSVIEALIQTPTAQALINGQALCWNSGIELFPDSEIHYYLDETILMIQWQEVTNSAVGTYAEVFLADASQFRRKIVDDQFGGMDFDYATGLAQQTNAVLASGGDFYNTSRNCGIVVYNREICRFDQTCDTCYINSSGDLLFSWRGQFSDESEAQQFVTENDILFSLCFGPVIIENGVDVTPESYPYGEINDTYARAALAQLGQLHYLTMNLNHGDGQYNTYSTLQQATDAMMAHGCPNAYALDGGQTASTVVNGELINPVQFGEERLVSDIIYFATAYPSVG